MSVNFDNATVTAVRISSDGVKTPDGGMKLMMHPCGPRKEFTEGTFRERNAACEKFVREKREAGELWVLEVSNIGGETVIETKAKPEVTVDRDLLKTLRPEIDAALAAIAARHGLQSLTATSGTFNPSGGSFTFKLEGIAKGGLSREAQSYETSRAYDKALPELGWTFEQQRRKYTVAGMNTTGSKVHCTRDDGKVFLFRTDDIRRMYAKVAQHG